MRSAPKSNNFLYLLLALLGFIVAIPILEYARVIPESFEAPLAFTILMLIGVWSLRTTRFTFHAGTVFVIVGVIANTLSAYKADTFYNVMALVAMFVFLSLATYTSLKAVLDGGTVDTNRIFGAVCVYLLVGILWSILYALTYTFDSSSFSGALSNTTESWSIDWLYFSFVTLTTIGYGDILPVSPAARALAYTEAIFGAFYLATLVALLIGAFLADQSDDSALD